MGRPPNRVAATNAAMPMRAHGGVSLPGPALTRTAMSGLAIQALFALVLVLYVTIQGTSLFQPYLATSTISLIGGLTFLLLPAIVAHRRGRLTPLSAEVIIPAAIYLTTMHAPLVRKLFSVRPLDLNEERVLELCVYGAYGVSTLLVAEQSRAARRSPGPVSDLTSGAAKAEALAGVVAAAVGLAFFVIWVDSVGVSTLLRASYAEVYLLAASHTTFTFAWPLCFGGVACTARALARFPGTAPHAYRVAHLAVLLAFVAISARLGMRGPIIQILLTVALVRADTGKPVPFKMALRVGIVLAALFFAITAVRRDLTEGFTLGEEKVEQTVNEGTNMETHGEFDAIFSNNAEMVRLAGLALPYRYGETYLQLPVQLVPRQILPEKPLQLSAWWIRYVDPVAADRGSGLAFGSFAEGYINFAGPGAVVQIGAVSLFLLLVFRLLRSSTVGVAGAAATILAYSYHSHRSEVLVLAATTRNAMLVGLAVFAMTGLLRVWLFGGGARSATTPHVRAPAVDRLEPGLTRSDRMASGPSGGGPNDR